MVSPLTPQPQARAMRIVLTSSLGAKEGGMVRSWGQRRSWEQPRPGQTALTTSGDLQFPKHLAPAEPHSVSWSAALRPAVLAVHPRGSPVTLGRHPTRRRQLLWVLSSAQGWRETGVAPRNHSSGEQWQQGHWMTDKPSVGVSPPWACPHQQPQQGAKLRLKAG